MSKHTPGPWEYGVRDDGSIWVSAGNIRHGAHWQGDFPGTKADARLVASAPDLLVALKFMYEAEADYITRNNLGDVHHNDRMKLARDVIAEIEGRRK